ncbi:Rha family transcriptional regulator [Sphingomonas paucimobilis]|uniref:Rha family transcriptional regulator n=1 Tax=Sphingomonas paucimobilis TaxID=13689 RepID=UPI00069E264C|nr:Rha family transcriptional regulator [Sphingomonas paucimobilis]
MIATMNVDTMISVVDGEAVADSRDVASAFDRRHSDVLKSIGDLVSSRPDLGRTFSLKVAKVDIGSGAQRDSHYYIMNRKGFVVLVGGFKGDRALDFRIAFYEAFERMERLLQRMPVDAQEQPQAARYAIFDDPDRLRNAIAFVRAAHVAQRCSTARRAWMVAGLPDVFGSDAIERFAAGACAVAPIVVRWADERLERSPEAQVSTGVLYQDFAGWAADCGHPAIPSLTAFGRQLSALGIESFRSDGIKRRGVRLISEVVA